MQDDLIDLVVVLVVVAVCGCGVLYVVLRIYRNKLRPYLCCCCSEEDLEQCFSCRGFLRSAEKKVFPSMTSLSGQSSKKFQLKVAPPSPRSEGRKTPTSIRPECPVFATLSSECCSCACSSACSSAASSASSTYSPTPALVHKKVLSPDDFISVGESASSSCHTPSIQTPSIIIEVDGLPSVSVQSPAFLFPPACPTYGFHTPCLTPVQSYLMSDAYSVRSAGSQGRIPCLDVQSRRHSL